MRVSLRLRSPKSSTSEFQALETERKAAGHVHLLCWVIPSPENKQRTSHPIVPLHCASTSNSTGVHFVFNPGGFGRDLPRSIISGAFRSFRRVGGLMPLAKILPMSTLGAPIFTDSVGPV